jgi:hypothetical protein
VATDVKKLISRPRPLRGHVQPNTDVCFLFAMTMDITGVNAQSVVNGDDVRIHLATQAVLVAERWVIIDASAPTNSLDHVQKTSGAGHPPSRVQDAIIAVDHEPREPSALETARQAEVECLLPPPRSIGKVDVVATARVAVHPLLNQLQRRRNQKDWCTCRASRGRATDGGREWHKSAGNIGE